MKDKLIGRKFEKRQILDTLESKAQSLIIVYGRRRIGKSFLIQNCIAEKNFVKFEGVEKKPFIFQLQTCLNSLSKYLNEPSVAKLKFDSWLEFFNYLAEKLAKKEIVLYFEEVQWLAEYKPDFATELKHAWDNHFARVPNIKIILCGSATSFMIREIVNSTALYGRAQTVVELGSFTLEETVQFFGAARSKYEALDAILTSGGVPEYLNYLKKESSIFTALAKHTFLPRSYFSLEFEKIFISNLANYRYYKKILQLLAKTKYLSRQDLADKLGISAGGTFSEILEDLRVIEFIDEYSTFEKDPEKSKLVRYCIRDNYINFYYKFIASKLKYISNGDFVDNPLRAINRHQYAQYLGYSFERFCVANSRRIAKILNFGEVEYSAGSWFKRGGQNYGFQIDLAFNRKDKVLTLCEIKYQSEPVGKEVVSEFEIKLKTIQENYKRDRLRIQKVLIAPNGGNNTAVEYFDRILTIDDFIA